MTRVTADDVEMTTEHCNAHLTSSVLHLRQMSKLLRDGIVADEVWKMT